MNIVAILAGGVGSRMGTEEPKQFLVVGRRTVLEHTIDAFAQSADVDAVVIVSHRLYTERVEHIVAAHAAEPGWSKVAAVVEGGQTRADSSRAAIIAAEEVGAGQEGVNLLIHDAARMLVGADVIHRVCAALATVEAAAPALPVTDTIVSAADGVMGDAIDRSVLRRMQTPQGFRLEVIRTAFERMAADPAFRPTDDCSVVRRFMPEVPVTLVEGSERNMKLTFPDDVPLFKFLATD